MSQGKTEVIAISSGKGGVGKTTLTVNLGIAMAKQGKQVCLFDADTNLANINIMLREAPKYTLQDVMDGNQSIEDIILHAQGISLIPGASGLTEFNELDALSQRHLQKAISQLEEQFDVILVDTSAGIHKAVLDFIDAAHQCIVLITPEPTSLTDSFSLLRMLRKLQYRKRINVVVNQAVSELGARKVFKRFSAAVGKYIGYHPAYLGYVEKDPIVSSAICTQVPVRIYRPDTVASRNYDRLAKSLLSLIRQQAEDKNLSENWKKQLISHAEVDLPLSASSPVLESEPQEQNTVSEHEQKKSGLKQSSQKEIAYQQADLARKKQVIEDHKQAIIDFIDDADFEKAEISLALDRFLNRFFKRFRDYPSDLIEQLSILLQTRSFSSMQLQQLMYELMSLYKDKNLRIEKKAHAEFLQQQINDYVGAHGEYPFDTTQAFMQSFGMGQVSDEAVLEIDTILGVVRYGSGQPNKKLQSKSENKISDIRGSNNKKCVVKHDTQVSIQSSQNKSEGDQLPNDQSNCNSKQADLAIQGLKDSIKFASRISDV